MTALMDLKVAWDAFDSHKRKHWRIGLYSCKTRSPLQMRRLKEVNGTGNCGKMRGGVVEIGMFAIFRMEGRRRSRACSSRATRFQVKLDRAAGRWRKEYKFATR